MPRYLSLLVIAGLGAEELFRRSAHDDSYGSITARRLRARGVEPARGRSPHPQERHGATAERHAFPQVGHAVPLGVVLKLLLVSLHPTGWNGRIACTPLQA